MQIVLNQNQVYTFKLSSGEELIAKVIQSGVEFIQIEEPVSIAPSQQGMQMFPSIFTADPKGEFRLNSNSVVMYAETDDNIKDKYLEATTGIKVPSKKIVLG
jgi:hypothetical protein